MLTFFKSNLLKHFHSFFFFGELPPQHDQQLVFPAVKVFPVRSKLRSYHPIVLTSCLRKTFEHILKCRLEWFLESNHLLPQSQMGFRKTRSTIDSITNLTSEIQSGTLIPFKVSSLYLHTLNPPILSLLEVFF